MSTPSAFSRRDSSTVSSVVQPPSTQSVWETRTRERQPVRHRGAHGLRRLHHDARAAVEVAAPGIVAAVGQRREELVQQVAMRRMQLDEAVAGLRRCASRRRRRRRWCRRSPPRVIARGVGVVAEGQVGWAPPASSRAAGAAVRPGRVAAAPCGRHGRSGCRARSPWRRCPAPGFAMARDVLIGPDAEVVGADAALGRHRAGLRHHQAGAADGAGDQVRVVPLGRLAVAVAGILAHGRDADAVGQRHAPQGQRREEIGHESGLRIGRAWGVPRVAGSRGGSRRRRTRRRAGGRGRR